MKLGRKLVLTGIGCIAFVAAAGYFVSPRFVADFMVRKIEAQSGLRAAIRSARLSLWPNIRITATGLTLTDANGADAPLLSVDEVRFGLSLDKLIAGQVSLTNLALTHPVLQLAEKVPAAAPDSATPADWTKNIKLTGPFTVTNGVFIDDNQRRQVKTRIEKIGLSAAPMPDGKLDLRLDGDIEGFGLRIDGKIVSAADFSAGRSTNFDGDVVMGAWDGTPRAVHMRLRLAAPVLTFDNLRATWTQGARQESLTAVGAFRWDGDAPKFTAYVDMETLNLGSTAWAQNLDTSGNALDTLSDRAIDFHQLRALDAAVEFHAGDVTAKGLHLGRIGVQTRLNDGLCKIVLDAPNFYHGKAHMNFTLDPSQGLAKQAIKANLSGVDTGIFLKDLGVAAKVAGNLDLGLDLSSNGSSPRVIGRNMAGVANLQFKNGIVTGVDLPDLFHAVTPYLPKAWRDLNDKISISALTANFQLSNGAASTDDLHIVSPVLDVTGKGSIDLAQRRFDLRFNPKVVPASANTARNGDEADQPGSTPNAATSATPKSPLDLGDAILVRGPWSDPQISADLSGMMQNPEKTLDNLQNLGHDFFSSPDNSQSDAIMKGLNGLFESFGAGGSPDRGDAKPQAR